MRHESRVMSAAAGRIFKCRASDVTSSGHAEAPGSGVVGFDNSRQAAKLV